MRPVLEMTPAEAARIRFVLFDIDDTITTAGKQKLVIDRKELDKMNGKRVLVVDDVISTGGSLKALDALAEQTKCTIVGQAAVLAEGDAAERKDIIFLEPLPLFLH